MNVYLPEKIKGEFNPIILLMHSPKEYWDELIIEMTKEYKLQN
jgi:hypothetical protein